MQTYSLIYKVIPTQFVFMIQSDGTVNTQIVSDVPKQMKFETLQKAKEYVKQYNENL